MINIDNLEVGDCVIYSYDKCSILATIIPNKSNLISSQKKNPFCASDVAVVYKESMFEPHLSKIWNIVEVIKRGNHDNNDNAVRITEHYKPNEAAIHLKDYLEFLV